MTFVFYKLELLKWARGIKQNRTIGVSLIQSSGKQKTCQYPFCCLEYLWQKDFSLPNASSRAAGSAANVIRSQFFRPTASPAEFFLVVKDACIACN